MLNGVPSGTIDLNFSGRGINADVTLSGVNSGDQITIEVRLDNGRARVESEQRDRDRDNDQGEDDDDDQADVNRDGRMEVKGSVSNLTGTCPDLRFMVGDRLVRTRITMVFADVSCMRVQNMSARRGQGSAGRRRNVFLATRVKRD